MSHQSLPSKFLTLYTVGYMVYTWEYTTVQQASRGVSYHSTLMWEGWEPLWTTILFELFILYTFFLHYLLFLTFNMQGHLFNISVKCRSYIFGPFIFHLVTCQSASEHHGTAGPHESVGVAGLCLKSLKSTRSKKTARACLSQVYKGLKRQVAPHPISEHISSSTLLEMLHCPTPWLTDFLTDSLLSTMPCSMHLRRRRGKKNDKNQNLCTHFRSACTSTETFHCHSDLVNPSLTPSFQQSPAACI